MEEIGTRQDYQEMLRRYIDIIWRRKIWILISLITGIVVSISLLFYLPKIYRSTTLILVEAQKVPEEYVRSAVSGSVEGRLSTIQQQILSRSFLQKIIDRFGLYQIAGEAPTATVEENIDRMRKNIEVKTVGSRNVDAFSISFNGKDPTTVMKVTSELASLFIEENLKIREQLVEGTTEFLDSELKNLKNTLEIQENKVGEFKRNSMGELPEQLEPNLRALDRFQSDLISTQLEKKSVQDRKASLEKALEVTKQNMDEIIQFFAEENEFPQELSSGFSSGVSASSPLQLKLNQKKKQLADLVAEYRENYPDVIMLKHEIQALEDQLGAEEKEHQAPVRDEKIPVRPAGKKSVNKPAINFDREPTAIVDLQKQVQTAKADLTRLKDRERELRDQIRIYERRVENIPSREQELVTLLRDYENTRKNYQVLLDKKLNAKISENLEKRQKGEQFRILDPANLPEKPIKPNPLMILLAGVGMGLAGGLGLVFIREQLDNSVRTPEELQKATSIPVLGSIPDFNDKSEQRRIAAVGIEKSSGENDGI